MSKKSTISKHQKLMYVLIAVVVVALGAFFLSGHSGGVGAGNAVTLPLPAPVVQNSLSCTDNGQGTGVAAIVGGRMNGYLHGCQAGNVYTRFTYTCQAAGATTPACSGATCRLVQTFSRCPVATPLCSNGVCFAPRCQGAVPANAMLCAGDDLKLVANVDRVAVAVCGANKCEYMCNAGLILQNGQCVAPLIDLPIEWDLNHDGRVDRSEGAANGDGACAMAVFNNLPLANGRAAILAACGNNPSAMRLMDADCNGRVSISEFQSSVAVLTTVAHPAGDANNDFIPDCAVADTDGDGRTWMNDNCPAVANPGQGDNNRDGIGSDCQCNDVLPHIVGPIPANSQLCPGDDQNFFPTNHSLSYWAVSQCSDAHKCEVTCNAGFSAVGGQCVPSVAQFCRYTGEWNRPSVETQLGVFTNSCQNNQLTIYTCTGAGFNTLNANTITCRDSWLSASLGCNPDGNVPPSCCDIWRGIPTEPTSMMNVSATNLRCEGSVFLNETSTTCGDQFHLTTLQHDCGAAGCSMNPVRAGSNPGCQ